MILTTQQLIDKYNNLVDPKGKISRDVKNGKIFQVARGIYETDLNVNGANLAQFIYAPSYLSFESVLSSIGLIPEAIYKTYTCATYNKRKKKIFNNVFGSYIYRDVPKEVFSYGVTLTTKEGYSYQVATAEKALCDKLYTVSPTYSLKAFKNLLFSDLRINKENLFKLDKEFIFKIAPLYKKKNLDFLVKYLKEN